MRRIFFILSICMALAACDDVPVAGEGMVQGTHVLALDADLVRYDSIMQSRPDSALVLLLSYPAQKEDETLSDSLSVKNDGINAFAAMLNRNYFYLLVSEALFKTDNMQTVRPQVQQAEYFFDSLAMQHPDNDDITFLSARSHYMNGVGFYENDSVVEACKEYLNALEIMEAHFNEDELVGQKAKFMALSYTRLGGAFYNYGNAAHAIECYKNALVYFKKTPNYSLANTYRKIANSYNLDNQNDSSLFYYKKAILLSKKEGNLSVYGSSLSESAPLYYKLGYKDSAFKMVRESLLLPKKEDQYLAKYYTYGYLLAKERKYDSAIFYLEQSIQRNNYFTQTASAELLMNCYEALGDSSMMQYYKMLYGNNFSTYRSKLTTEDRLSKLYEICKTEKLQNHNLSQDRQRYSKVTIIIFVCFISTIILFVFIKIIQDKIQVRNEIELKENALVEARRKIAANTFMDEPICKAIFETVSMQQFKSKVGFKVYKDFALSKDQLLALRGSTDRHYNDFTKKLYKQYPQLSYDDVDYCCLYLLGLKDADVSALMQRSFTAVCDRKRKLKRIFKTKDNISLFLKNMTESGLSI